MLFERMLANATWSREWKRQPDLEKWAVAINQLHRIDGIEYDVIERVLEWSQRDRFWRVNILSGAKLREKFTTLHARAIGSVPGDDQPQRVLA
jgi:hypothetical protein